MLICHQVKYALETLPLKLVEQFPFLGKTGLTGKTGLSNEEAALVQRFDPVECDSIGFFIAKFVKIKK